MWWNIYARSPNGTRAGEIDDAAQAQFMPVFNDVGTWSVKLHATSAQVENMAQPGAGVILCRNDQPLLSGPMRSFRRVKRGDENSVEFSGYTDEVWLKNRLVSPSPAEAQGPYTVQAADNRSGAASTVLSQYVNVNAGPGAITARRVPGLTIGADLVIGSSVSGSGRWENLLTFLQPLAKSGGVGFRVVQNGNNLQFQVYQPTDRSGSVKFSGQMGNLGELDYSVTAPNGNYEYVGGAGTGTGRTIKEYTDNDSIAAWGRIEGEFVDRRDTSDSAQLQQSGTDALSQGTEQLSLSITPIETDYQRFGTHYFLGDTVAVRLEEGALPTIYGESGVVVDTVRSVVIKFEDGVTVTPVIGTPGRSDLLRIFQTLKRAVIRLNQLERQ